jgi:hypothetical protein
VPSVILGVIALVKPATTGKRAKVSGNRVGIASRSSSASCAKTGQNWLRSPKPALRLPASQPTSQVLQKPLERQYFLYFHATLLHSPCGSSTSQPIHHTVVVFWSKFDGSGINKSQVTFRATLVTPPSPEDAARDSCRSHVGFTAVGNPWRLLGSNRLRGRASA